MTNKNKFSQRQKQTFKYRDDRLLLLQKYLTKKISGTQDEELIKHLLREGSRIAQLRLRLRKEWDNASRYSEVRQEHQLSKLSSKAV